MKDTMTPPHRAVVKRLLAHLRTGPVA